LYVAAKSRVKFFLAATQDWSYTRSMNDHIQQLLKERERVYQQMMRVENEFRKIFVACIVLACLLIATIACKILDSLT
jgi:hypothetical protein